MEMVLLILWISIINGGLGGQYILNWMGNQPKFVGDKTIGVSAGVMTWWREISKLLWATIAVITEIVKGKELKYFNPGYLSMITIMICAFTGVIENIGFFYLPRYYSPHIFAPYVNIYLAFLPFFGKFLFDSTLRKEHWFGAGLVVLGLVIPHIPYMLGSTAKADAVLDLNAVIWILIINACLCSQQVLNNKTVQTALKGVGPNALVFWREIWKLVFISSALFIIPFIASVSDVNLPERVEITKFEKNIIAKTDEKDIPFLLDNYTLIENEYVLKNNINEETQEKIESIISETDHNRFFSLFSGSIIPDNWLPILFVVAAGLTGYIYSFGFFKLSKFAAHLWVPYTNLWLAFLPLIMFLFGKDVTIAQIIGAVVVTGGLMVGVSDYSKNKVEEIEKKYK